jgi:Holliday junction resolvase
MSREGTLNIGSSSGSLIKATMWFDHMRAKEHSRLSGALLIQAKYSKKGKGYIHPEEKTRLAAATRQYKGHCCIVYNEKRKLKWKLVDPYYYVRRK